MKKIYHQKKSSYPIRTRHALSLLILLFLCVSAHSQAFYGGIAAGAVTSQVDGDENNGFHKAGFTAGAFVGLELSDIFDLQFEIKYIQKGSKSSTDDQMDFSIKLDYIEVPLVVSANLGFFNINGKKFDWISFETGLSLDVLARVRQTYEKHVFQRNTRSEIQFDRKTTIRNPCNNLDKLSLQGQQIQSMALRTMGRVQRRLRTRTILPFQMIMSGRINHGCEP